MPFLAAFLRSEGGKGAGVLDSGLPHELNLACHFLGVGFVTWNIGALGLSDL